MLDYNIHVSFCEILLVHFFKRRNNSRALVPWAVVIERLDVYIIDQPLKKKTRDLRLVEIIYFLIL